MDPGLRQTVLDNLGFKLLDFPYVQPALSADRQTCHHLVIACHTAFLRNPLSKPTQDSTDRIDSINQEGSSESNNLTILAPDQPSIESQWIDSSIIISFVRDSFVELMGEHKGLTNEDYLGMVEFARLNPHVLVVPAGTR